MAKHSKASSRDAAGRRRVRRLVGSAAVAAAVVAAVDAVAIASSTTSEGIVSITPHTLASGALINAGKSVSYVVSGGSTTVPTDATRVQFSVTVSNQAQPGSLTSAPYLDPADASGDSLSWQAAKTTVSGTFIEPVGVSNKVLFTNTSAGTVTFAVKITGYSTSARLAARLDAVERHQSIDESNISALQGAATSLAGRVSSDESNISSLQSASAALSNQLNTAQSNISSLSSRLSADEALLQSLPRLTVTSTVRSATTFFINGDGANLLPGSDVVAHYVYNGNPQSITLATVDAKGDANLTGAFLCGVSDFYVTSSDMGSDQIASNRIAKGAGCP